jgi:hypothetical protein
MTIDDGAMVPLGGTIDNSGTIAHASTSDGATLEVQVSGVTLQGGGKVLLSDDGRNFVTAGPGHRHGRQCPRQFRHARSDRQRRAGRRRRGREQRNLVGGWRQPYRGCAYRQ